MATTAPIKRPVEIIETPEYDPTIRKKRRTEHPLNTILAKRLEVIQEAKNKPPPVVCHLSDSDSDNEQEPPSPSPKNQSSTVSTDLNLSISSDSSMEEGEILEPSKNNNNNDNGDSAPVTPQLDLVSDSGSDTSSNSKSSSETSESRYKPVSKIPIEQKQVKPKCVNFDLNATKICEYGPESTSKVKPPVYTPTPIVRPQGSSGSVPRKDILFDMWQIIRKIDQGIGRDLEFSMIKRGFLKARFTR